MLKHILVHCKNLSMHSNFQGWYPEAKHSSCMQEKLNFIVKYRNAIKMQDKSCIYIARY